MKFYIYENELLNNTQFKVVQTSEDEFEILATYQGHIIAKLNLDIMAGMFDYYFQGDFTEEEYDQYFPNDATTFISWVEVYNDIHKGNGIARRLMNMAIEKSKQLGFDRIYLNASPIQSEKSLPLNDLVDFYKSFGFEIIKHQGGNAQMLLTMDSINEYKSLIKTHLLEAFHGRKTSRADLFRTQERIQIARAFIASRPQHEKPYWETITHDPKQQGFRAAAVLNPRGDIKISTYTAAASDVSQNQYGVRGEDDNTMTFFISAHPGINHPTTMLRSGHAITQGGINDPHVAEIGSPASDAQIKAYAIYGEVILDFLKSKLEGLEAYTDGSAANIANQLDDREKILMLNKELKTSKKKYNTTLRMDRFFKRTKKTRNRLA
jgi:GNAT superfamily N-acetyltransferase